MERSGQVDKPDKSKWWGGRAGEEKVSSKGGRANLLKVSFLECPQLTAALSFAGTLG